jgi:hypothetical protein
VRDLALERKQAAAKHLAEKMAKELLLARQRWNF